jgi:hypothetical protein
VRKKKGKALARWLGAKRRGRSKTERIEVKMELCSNLRLGKIKR